MPSVFIAQTSLLRRSVCTKTSGNTFPYRPRTRLISPYYDRDTIKTAAGFHISFPYTVSVLQTGIPR